ncbi:Aquaporin Z 2 [Methylocystis sp. MJC1]|nr:Aquaporin Z 2 [Methylocystis sp. MJC1]MBU6525874.1 aquaporin Z [Methylocystis sp. MJC1]
MPSFSSSDIIRMRAAEAAPLHKNWGWMVAFGALLALAGFVALGSVVLSTIATVLVVGVAMIVSGFIEIAYAFAMRSWGKFFLWIVIGLLYVVGGGAVVQNPLLAAGFLTLLLGAGLVASGLVRIFLAFQLPKDAPWGFVALSGVVTFLVGGVILAQWPVSSLWALGVFLGVDLIFAGASWIGFGMSLRDVEGGQAAGFLADESGSAGSRFGDGFQRKLFAEFLGTFWLVFGGCGSALISAGFPQLGIGFTGVSLAFGLTVLTGAYAFGPVSGGHFNPAVSLGLATAGRFSWKELGPYWLVQLIGATAAAFVLLKICEGNIDFSLANGFAANGYDEHSPNGYTLQSAFLVETVLTAFFLLVILGVTEGRAPVGFAPLAIGLALTLIHLVDIPITNASVNPARSTSQALFVGGWALEQLWLFWVAPLLGGLIGGLIHRFALADRA